MSNRVHLIDGISIDVETTETPIESADADGYFSTDNGGHWFFKIITTGWWLANPDDLKYLNWASLTQLTLKRVEERGLGNFTLMLFKESVIGLSGRQSAFRGVHAGFWYGEMVRSYHPN